ncbi:MAG: type I pullulanase [Lagierella massiliensis]|nr:type I pullulanase [Lagierella massiliensis]
MYEDIKDVKLGVIYSEFKSDFRVWSPNSKSLKLLIYDDCNSSTRREFEMIKDDNGFWEISISENLNLKYYNYLIDEKYEVTDPYGVSACPNSRRSCIIDLEMTNPVGFKDHKVPNNKPENAIIYETHVKDFTYHKSVGIEKDYRGKFLGLTEENTKYQDVKTGLDHLKELGITHLHLMPIFDYLTVDENNEAFDNDKNYNWGYDPELYNVPEGSYSTDSTDPIKRVKELKQLIMKAHENNISVVMDVVYNHTFRTLDSNFNQLNPFYYYRMDKDNKFSNGSGCGNEFASESDFGRKFIMDSLKYWVDEYKIDGFRFDLMALMDRETVDNLVMELKKINPNILIYGEPWMAWSSTLPINCQTLPGSQKGRGFSIFNSEFRDAIKGDNDGTEKGYIQGRFDLKRKIQIGIMGSIVSLDGYEGLTMYPMESINYFNSHDNLILADKLAKSLDPSDLSDFNQISKMAFNIILLAFGIPFFHAGNEFSRSKNMDHNSYHSPISVNQVDWSFKKRNIDLNNHVKNLISLRKKYSEYMLKSYEEIAGNLYFIYNLPNSVIGYTILGERGMLLILHNCGRGEFVLENRILNDHVKECYKDVELKDLKLIFDENGQDKGTKELNDNMVIPRITTYVYKLGC